MEDRTGLGFGCSRATGIDCTEERSLEAVGTRSADGAETGLGRGPNEAR